VEQVAGVDGPVQLPASSEFVEPAASEPLAPVSVDVTCELMELMAAVTEPRASVSAPEEETDPDEGISGLVVGEEGDWVPEPTAS
jgi:hypothetical protein